MDKATGKETANVFYISVIIVIVGIFYFTTIRERNQLWGDYSMYIRHAINICKGIDYKDTGCIYNSYISSPNPKIYPPIFPLLLAIVYKFFGMNFLAMRVEMILFFLLSLFVITMVFKDQLPSQFLILTIILIAFNPFFWDFKDNILSDIPFLFFIYLSIFSINKLYTSELYKKNKIQYLLLVSILFYLSFGTRYIGVILIPTLYIVDLIKKPSLFPVKVTLIFICSILAQNLFLIKGLDFSYFNLLASYNLAHTFIANLRYYFGTLSDFWSNGYLWFIKKVLFAIISGLAAFGYFIRIRHKEKITFFEIFFGLYITLLIFAPCRQGMRFLIPIFPLYIFYAFIGIQNIAFLNSKRYILIILTIFIFASYVGQYSKLDWSRTPVGASKKESVEFFKYVREKTNKDDIFIFLDPRAFYLFTERRTSAYHKPKNDEELLNYFQKIGATYIAICPYDGLYIRDFIDRQKDKFYEVYSNADFKLYRIL